MNRLLIITPTLNEASFVQRTIDSVMQQSVVPDKWVFIDDDSFDETAEIIARNIAKYPCIEYYKIQRKSREFGKHVGELFNFAKQIVDFTEFRFLLKLDADIVIDWNYALEYLLQEFIIDDKLGIVSGITYSLENDVKTMTKGRPEWHTGGAFKLYRFECFEEIGGIQPIYGWDGLDEYQAMYRGWKTKTFYEVHLLHLGKSRAVAREKLIFLSKQKGISLYQRGYPLEFVTLKAMHVFFFNPIRGIAILFGYLQARLSRVKIYVNDDEKKFIRKFQYLRIYRRFFGKF